MGRVSECHFNKLINKSSGYKSYLCWRRRNEGSSGAITNGETVINNGCELVKLQPDNNVGFIAS